MSPLRTVPLSLALLLTACGGADDPAPEAAATPAPPADTVSPTGAVAHAPPPAAPAEPADAPLTAADLDAYVTGLTREIQVLKQHAERLQRARAAQDQDGELAAMMALSGVEVRDAGAAAAGLDAARYVAVKERVDSVLAALEMGGAMRPQLEAAERADLSGFTPEQRRQHDEGLAQLRTAFGAPYATLPAGLVDAFKAREAELAALRAEALALRLGALKP